MSLILAIQIHSYVRVSSTGSANSIIDKITISTSENHSVRFHNLFMLTLNWCPTPLTEKAVLWKMLLELVDAPARWWSWECLKSVCGLRSGDKKSIFFRSILVLDLMLKWKRGKLATASLLLLCFDEYSCLFHWDEFVSSVFQVSAWSFLVTHFYGKFCNWFSKFIRSQKDWFCVFWLITVFSVDFISAWT